MSLDNPMPGGQTPPAGAQQPAYPAYAGYPTYPGYPGYPAYAPHPYYGYAAAAHAGPPVLPPVPSRAPDKPARQHLTSFVVLVVLAGLTAAALALAAAAPSLVARDPGPPTGYTQAYTSTLRDQSTDWDVTKGCMFEGGGLYADGVSSPAICRFLPSASADYTSNSFYITTELAPPGAVPTTEGACVLIGDQSAIAVSVAIDQNALFSVSTDGSSDCLTVVGPGHFQQATSAWHGNGYLPNTLSLAYDSRSSTLIVYLNGQQIAQQTVQLSGASIISLGAPAGDAAIFTSFSLWTRS